MDANVNIWEYFARREEEIVKLREKLLLELEMLRAAREAAEARERSRDHQTGKGKLTIKELIKSVLNEYPEGGSSDQIVSWIQQKHGTEVARTSLTPQLSRLKADDEVELDEEVGKWRLSPSVHPLRKLEMEEGTPTGRLYRDNTNRLRRRYNQD